MDLLPPHLKHKILSMDPKLMSAAYGDNINENENNNNNNNNNNKNNNNKNNENNNNNNFPSLSIKDSTKLKLISSDQIHSLEKNGYVVIDNFLGRDALLRFKADGVSMYSSGDLRPAKMNKGDSQWKQSEIRGDTIKWLHNNRESEELKEKYKNLGELLNTMDSIRLELDSACEFNSTKSQVQIARYPEGTRYVRHRDAFIGSSEPSRRITVLYYLNESWTPADGGCLRMFLKEGEKEIEPIGDRMVIFWSEYVDHEVMLSNKERFAVTMWYY